MPKTRSQAQHPNGFVVGTAHADFGGHDFSVQAVFAFLALSAIAEFSSDGSILQKKPVST